MQRLLPIKTDSRGQVAMVGTSLTLIISLIIGIIILNEMFLSTEASLGTTTYNSYATKNSGFTDNDSENCPAYWDNSSSTRAQWNQASGYVYDNADNSTVTWYQSLTIDTFTTVTSATINAKFRLYDNDNLTDFLAQVILERNATDNVVIWQSTSTDNSLSYTSIENGVKSYITASGTYRIILLDNGTGGGPASGNTIETRWDDASLTASTSIHTIDADTQAAYDKTRAFAWVGIGLMSLAIIILAAVTILGIVRGGLGGGGKV